MRQHLAKLLFSAATLSGCSLIYDTSELPRIDAPPDQAIDAPLPDMPIDADPSMLMLASVSPTVIYEGQGDVDGGSAPAVIVIEGANFDTSQNLTVTITRTDGSEAPIVVEAPQVAGNHQLIAVPVRVPVLESAEGPIALQITVAQDSPIGRQERMQTGLSVQMLPELVGAVTLANQAPVHEFSRVEGSITVSPGSEPARVHSWSRMSVSGVLGLSASGKNPGPAGGVGGDGGPASQAGKEGGGPGGGAGGAAGASGQAGDPGTWVGAPALPTLLDSACCRSSGGGGGGGSTVLIGGLGQPGDVGGGGGGSLHLRAEGDLVVTNGIAATGAAGTTGGGGGGDGGGGTGGVVLLQAGRLLTASGPMDVSGGGGADAGKVRFDTPDTDANSASAGYRGPAFVTPPQIVNAPRPTLKIIGTQLATIGYFIIGGGTSTPIENAELGSDATDVPLGRDLYPGLNKVCLLVPGTTDKNSDTRSCIDIAYLPQ